MAAVTIIITKTIITIIMIITIITVIVKAHSEEIEGLAAIMRYFIGIHYKGNWIGLGRDRRFK